MQQWLQSQPNWVDLMTSRYSAERRDRIQSVVDFSGASSEPTGRRERAVFGIQADAHWADSRRPRNLLRCRYLADRWSELFLQ